MTPTLSAQSSEEILIVPEMLRRRNIAGNQGQGGIFVFFRVENFRISRQKFLYCPYRLVRILSLDVENYLNEFFRVLVGFPSIVGKQAYNRFYIGFFHRSAAVVGDDEPFAVHTDIGFK